MKTLSIIINKGYADCEDCGGYEWGRAEFVVDGKSVAHVVHDGHMGSGCWDGELTKIYLWALGLIGYQVRFTGLANGETALMPLSMYVRDEEKGYGYREVVFPPSVILDVPAGLCPLEDWEIEQAKEDGTPAPTPQPYTADSLDYCDLSHHLKPLLHELSTCGIEINQEPYESPPFSDEEEDWNQDLGQGEEGPDVDIDGAYSQSGDAPRNIG